MTPTTVVSVRGVNGEARAALLAAPDFVYVGRAFAGWKPSPWGNPFKPLQSPAERARIARPYGLEVPAGPLTVLDLYRLWAQNRAAAAPAVYDLSALRGKRLGCWCGGWRPGEPDLMCHAVVLAKLADAPGTAG